MFEENTKAEDRGVRGGKTNTESNKCVSYLRHIMFKPTNGSTSPISLSRGSAFLLVQDILCLSVECLPMW